MRDADVRELLGRLEEASTPEPSALFVAKLEADLRAMDQTSEAEAPRHRTRRARVLVAAAPVAVLATAAAAAAVMLLPSKSSPRQVNTADPGVTAPAPPSDASPTSVPTPTTVVVPPWLPPVDSPTPPTTAVAHPAPTTVPAPVTGDHSSPKVAPPPEPVSTTVPRATTTTTPAFETPSLHCTSGVSGGQPGVSCTWSPSTSSSFHWYRLYREVPGTNRVLVFSSDNRSTTTYADKDVQAGTTYSYRVEVTDSTGTVIGRSAAFTVPCC